MSILVDKILSKEKIKVKSEDNIEYYVVPFTNERSVNELDWIRITRLTTPGFSKEFIVYKDELELWFKNFIEV